MTNILSQDGILSIDELNEIMIQSFFEYWIPLLILKVGKDGYPDNGMVSSMELEEMLNDA